MRFTGMGCWEVHALRWQNVAELVPTDEQIVITAENNVVGRPLGNTRSGRLRVGDQRCLAIRGKLRLFVDGSGTELVNVARARANPGHRLC